MPTCCAVLMFTAVTGAVTAATGGAGGCGGGRSNDENLG